MTPDTLTEPHPANPAQPGSQPTAQSSTQPTLEPTLEPSLESTTKPGAPYLDSEMWVRATNSPAAPLLLTALWALLFATALFAPPVLDDADATHASAARHILTSGDWVTLRVNGIRYLEKAPLPYWITALSFRLFGINTFATHLPQALAVLLLTLLGYHWARTAYDARTGLYTGLATLTSAGVFLFTRIFIPEVWLALFLAVALYTFLRSLEPATTPGISSVASRPATTPGAPSFAPLSLAKGGVSFAEANDRSLPRATHLYPYTLWLALALAVLSKGLVALVLFFGAAALYLALTGDYKHFRRLKPLTGPLLFLLIAAPWHLLAGLRNPNGFLDGHPHGFFWFYFINEHVLRFLGRRIPMDYNKLPGYLFWSLHLVWLFPWALFAPLAAWSGWRLWKRRRNLPIDTLSTRTTLLLTLFSALVLLFFSLSTNQEYYTFPAYLPLLILLTAALTRAESTYAEERSSRRSIAAAHAALTILGAAIAATLTYGLWTSRHLPFVPDIGDLLAHRGVGDYTLSMSHLFDLTGPSFAALRLPATLAALAFALGPGLAWLLRARRHHLAATSAVALTSAVFLLAAHIALCRFAPMLSSQDFAATIERLERTHAIAPDTQILLYGDQAYGSSIPFYLGRQVSLVEGRSTSMLFGSTFPDAPHLFLTDANLLAAWGTGPRKILFVPLEKRDAVDHLLGTHQILLQQTSGKALLTDRPLP
jgi:4-amino-4-deoxy-L-arabinose transferase-like glycosyltransferase